MEANNIKAMREALKQIHELLSIGGNPDTAMCIRYEAAYQIAEEALAEPLRNCDIGTAEEQYERYEKFCYAHRSREKGCGDCPLCDIPCCEFAWLQMPYEEGGAK